MRHKLLLRKLLLIIQFILVYGVLGVPPMLSAFGIFPRVDTIRFSYIDLVALPLAGSVLVLSHYNKRGAPIVSPHKGGAIHTLASSTIALGVLFISGAVCSALDTVLPIGEHSGVTVDMAESAIEWVVAVLAIFSMALLEEALYRDYIPGTLSLILPIRMRGVAVAVSLALFTLPHLYLGVYGTINALIAGVTLYMVYNRALNIMAVTVPHFIFNLVQYALFSRQ